MEGKRKGLILFIVTAIILLIVGLFVGRVVWLYGQIAQGNITGARSQSSALTISPRLENAIRNPDPSKVYDVNSDDDPSIGSPDAVLTIVEFADFGCPYSREASFAIRTLASTYSDRIRYVYRDFPITELHSQAQQAAEAGQCAFEQDETKFWALHDLMYQNQDALSRGDLRAYAQQVGLNVSNFERCMNSGRYTAEVLEDYNDGIAADVYGTPTFFFNGQAIPGVIPIDTLQLIVEAYLK